MTEVSFTNNTIDPPWEYKSAALAFSECLEVMHYVRLVCVLSYFRFSLFQKFLSSHCRFFDISFLDFCDLWASAVAEPRCWKELVNKVKIEKLLHPFFLCVWLVVVFACGGSSSSCCYPGLCGPASLEGTHLGLAGLPSRLMRVS